jgi:hypothetical protein
VLEAARDRIEETMMTSEARIQTVVNASDHELTKGLVQDWTVRHGRLQACSAYFEVEHAGRVKFYPGKVISYHFADGKMAQVYIDLATGKVKVTRDPDAARSTADMVPEAAPTATDDYLGMMKTQTRTGR